MRHETNAKQDEIIMSDGRLVYAVSAIMRKASDRALAPWGVSISQAPVLVVLREAGYPLTVSEMARHLYLETPSITTMVDRLAERGFVERLKDREDRRKTLVQLTKSGKKLVDSIREPGEQLQEEMFAVLGRKERETLRVILQKLRDGNASRI